MYQLNRDRVDRSSSLEDEDIEDKDKHGFEFQVAVDCLEVRVGKEGSDDVVEAAYGDLACLSVSLVVKRCLELQQEDWW